MKSEQSSRSFYEGDSSSYDRKRWESRAGAHTNAVQQKILQDLCTTWRKKRIIEIGPGTGRFSQSLCRMDNTMTLTDISSAMLNTAQQNIEAAGLSEQVDEYVEGSIYELPFENESFDHAISLNVFNHLETPGKALAEMARVIKPASTLLFNFANLQSYFWPAGRRINRQSKAIGQDVYSQWITPADAFRMIDRAGLDLVEQRGHVHTPRALEKLMLYPAIHLLDLVSHRWPLRRLAPVLFCLCRKRES